MKCPSCNFEEDKVIESRPAADGTSVRRRRECLKCGYRFTSYERVEERPLLVVKRDGRRERFNREKILGGILKACEKRSIGMEVIEGLVAEIERAIYKNDGNEVETSKIGQLVMEKLHELDQVAYVRFASVYRRFEDVKDFVKEIKKMPARPAGGEV